MLLDTDPQTGPPPGLPLPHVEGVEHRWTSIDGLRLHYAEAGEGPPVVLVHGWPQHWWSWRHAIGPLSERFRVICPDIRGLGWSEGSTAPGGYTLHRLAADVLGMLDVLGIESARLVGHDWGAAIGYRACLNWPDRFQRYVALGGVHPWAAFSRPRLYVRPWHIYALAGLSPAATTRLGIPESALRAWRHVGRFTPEEEQVYLSALRLPSAAAATRQYYRNVVLREIPHFWRHHRAMRNGVPTLHLNGARDPLTQGLSRGYRPYAPEMDLQTLPGCGHFIGEEAPELLVDRLIQFFS
jgi:pimeloyl-ACP methyl ester carboxylesterase